MKKESCKITIFRKEILKIKKISRSMLLSNTHLFQKLLNMTFHKNSPMAMQLKNFKDNKNIWTSCWCFMDENSVPIAWAIGTIKGKNEKTVAIAVYVTRKYRRKGLGKILVQKITFSAKRKGYLEFRYYRHDNKSFSFYSSLGFFKKERTSLKSDLHPFRSKYGNISKKSLGKKPCYSRR